MKHYATGAAQWLQLLKLHWDISTTQMRDNPDCIMIMHFGKSGNLVVGYYDKEIKSGYIFDRRRKIR